MGGVAKRRQRGRKRKLGKKEPVAPVRDEEEEVDNVPNVPNVANDLNKHDDDDDDDDVISFKGQSPSPSPSKRGKRKRAVGSCSVSPPATKKRKRNLCKEEEEEEEEEDCEITLKKVKSDGEARTTTKEAAASSPPPPPPRRSPNGYILPDPLPQGLVVTDVHGNYWKISRSIGLGGFGEIYAASSFGRPGEDNNPDDYVIKVEPHTNGPLFVEINFYIRGAQREDIADFARENNWKHLGVPHFVASGSFTFRKNKYRFMVLPRFGNDLAKLSDHCGGGFEKKTAIHIALQVLNSLEYVHSKGFVHKDIKGSNLLLDRQNPNKVYLVDFGLSSKYIHHGIHKPYTHDARWAHEGTLEYTSRDAHIGCPSRRGDLEVLLYNFIEWLGGRLPWDMNTMQKPIFYKTEKFRAFENPAAFLKASFNTEKYPGRVNIYLINLHNCVFLIKRNNSFSELIC